MEESGLKRDTGRSWYQLSGRPARDGLPVMKLLKQQGWLGECTNVAAVEKLGLYTFLRNGGGRRREGMLYKTTETQ